MTTVEDRLAALGLTLPEPIAPVANYVPYVRTGALVHIAGQISIDAEGGIRGVVGEDLDLEQGMAAAGATLAGSCGWSS
jgi:enamine deaminase RidA (YjgF/YER057c/UK114 family)